MKIFVKNRFLKYKKGNAIMHLQNQSLKIKMLDRKKILNSNCCINLLINHSINK